MNRFIELLKDRPWLIVLSVGLIFRLAYLIFFMLSPEWNHLVSDSLFHDRWAQEIASGNITGSEVFFRGPLYIYILGCIYSIFGHSLLAARIFGLIVGLISLFITYKIADRLFGNKTALIAGLIHALYPVVIFFESELLAVGLFTLLFELSILTLFLALEKKRYKYFIFTGLTIGLAAITRPVILGLLPIYLIVPFIFKIDLAKNIIGSATILIITILLILPVTLRNLSVADDFVLISSTGGINFYIGNNEKADGLSAALPPPLGFKWSNKDTKYLAESDVGRTLTPSEQSGYWYNRGNQWIWSNKGDFLRLYIKKLYFWASDFLLSSNRNLTAFFDQFLILKYNPVRYWVIISLFAVGLLFTLAGKIRPEQLILIIFISAYILLTSLFFINSRFKLPAIPLMTSLAGYGLVRFFSGIRIGKFNHTYYGAIIIFILTAWLSLSNFFNIDKNNILGGLFNRANYYMYLGEKAKAVEYYFRVLAKDNNYPEVNLNLGVYYLKFGMADSAEYYFQRELQVYPENSRALSNLASLYYLQNNYELSKEYAQEATLAQPYLPEGWLLLMRNTAATSDSIEFKTILADAEKNLNDLTKVHLDAGLIYSQWKDYNLAEKYLKLVLESRRPSLDISDHAFGYDESGSTGYAKLKARAAYQLGYLSGIQNRLEESISYSNSAIRLDSTLVEAYINLSGAYLSCLKTGQARQVLSEARRRFPDNKIIQAMSNQLP